MTTQAMSNYKKRQLFSKMQHQTKTNEEDKKNKHDDREQDEKNNHQPSSSNSLSNTKDFIPSPQFGSFHQNNAQQSPFYEHYKYNHHQQQNHNSNQHQQSQSQADHFQPNVYESYTTLSPYSSYHQPPPQPKWNDHNLPHQPVDSSYLPANSPPHLSDLNKDYPKFEEYAKHLQKEHHKEAPVQWYPPAAKEKGKFVWLPEGDEIKFFKPKEEFNLKPDIKNGTGKWKWIPDNQSDIGDQPESKIIAHGPTHPTYYEQIKIYQEPKPIYVTAKDHPYQFDYGTEQTPSVFNDGNGQISDDGHHHEYSYHNHDHGLETTTVEPSKGGGMNLVDVLFNAWNQNDSNVGEGKEKEKDKGLEQSRKKQ